MKQSLFILLLIGGIACSNNQINQTPELFEKMENASLGINFMNEVVNGHDFNIFSYRNFYNGGGVALGDINNDGLTDVFFTANMGPNKLYLNKGDWTFEDISATAGIEEADKWSTGVAMVDINNDGWLDIYVCNAGYLSGADQKNSLFLNQQNGTFREAAVDYGLDENGYTTHAAFFDYDLDGDLDVYMLNNSFIPVSTLNYSNNRGLYAEDWEVRDFLKGGGDKLLKNENGQFIDVSKEAGIYGSLIGFGLGITVGDINGDHFPDLYVSNDFFERDYLYINQQDGTFKEEIEDWMQHISLASMGADMADLNNDGYPEIFVTEMLPESDFRRKTTVQFEDLNIYQLKQNRGFYHQFMHNTLQYNNQDGTFSEIAYFSGVAATDWSWGALMFDADNDGFRDIYVCNGIYHNLTNQDFIDFFANDVVQKMVLTGEKESIEEVINQMPKEALPNKFFRNQHDLRFADQGKDWGVDIPSFSNGAAYGDLDNDGDLDLVVNNVNQEPFIFQNHADQRENNFLRVQLKGSADNTYAVGAKVAVYQNDHVLNTHLIPTRGFQSSVDYTAVFGLGENAMIDSVKVVWPDRSTSTVVHPPSNELLVLDYERRAKDNMAATQNLATLQSTYFQPTELSLQAHREDDHIDLFNEGLVIRSLSKEGPKAVVGDLNGDGQEDLFIGGARYQPGQLYFQQNGQLVPSDQAVFRQISETEDTGLALFDADGDGDLDLYIGSGGNFTKTGFPFLGDKLLFNDGTGQFSIHSDVLPRIGLNTSVVVPLDFDEDGDIDLFVGTRSLPQNYGAPVPSLLLENNGEGRFQEVTRKHASIFATLGMVTDAKWVDFDGKNQKVLVVTSEWGAPKFLSYQNDQFVELGTNLANYAGWWYSLETEDLDNDGDQDLILGNRGENFYFSASPKAPTKLWIADFDDNGTVEKIITQSFKGQDKPIAMKRELTEQLVSLKKGNLKHTEYATKAMTDLFPRSELQKARVLEANYFKSIVALNNGNGQFTIIPLPKEVQFSCVCDIACTDLNGDGSKDLVLGGNESAFLPQFSRLDASFGHVLINEKEGHFRRVKNRESGLLIKGDLKSLQHITLDGVPHLLATRNNQSPVFLQQTARGASK